jgi:hypothetical protein
VRELYPPGTANPATAKFAKGSNYEPTEEELDAMIAEQLLIHAGKSRSRIGDYGEGEPSESSLVFGAILGRVELVDCVRVERVAGQPFAEGPWCWILRNPVAFDEPVPYRGAQMLYDVPDNLIPQLVQ